jgi:carbamoyltransferase
MPGLPFTLALSDSWHDSAYAVFDGSAIRHVEVERLTRRKYEALDPFLAVCAFEPRLLERAEMLLLVENELYAPFLRETARAGDAAIETFVARVFADNATRLPDGIGQDRIRPIFERALRRMIDGTLAYRILSHHFCHAANAFLSSGFDNAISVTLDGGGTNLRGAEQVYVNGSVYDFAKDVPLSDEPLHLVEDWSPGYTWDRACQSVGLTMHDAGTMMAMAAYGRRNPVIEAIVRSDLFWSTWLDATRGWRRWLMPWPNRLRHLLRSEAGQFSLGLAMQRETERRIRKFLGRFLAGREQIDLCLSGGTFLNCIAAHKVREWFPQVREVYIPPVPYDAGLPIGSLQQFLHQQGLNKLFEGPICPFADPPIYSEEDVLAACREAGVTPRGGASVEEVVELLDDGAIVAQFQGGSESGRRALGNRSVLCDPRRDEHRVRLNATIKRRQWYRPFAPMILAEEAANWFVLPERFASPYMSFAASFREGMGERVPAVRHADGTARLQTVHAELTPRTHRLLSAWHARTGIPILLNTSFNENEPIVETPAEAIATFLRSGLDALYFADHGILVRADATVSAPR